MIDIGKILKRSWHILWNYRILWVFGFLLAITGGGGSSSSGGSGSSYRTNNNDFNTNTNFQTSPFWKEMTNWYNQYIAPVSLNPEKFIATFIWIGVAVLLFILVVGALIALVRYPSETAVIRMVDGYEQTGVKTDFRQGWKLGWNRRAFRIWVIDLLIGVPSMLLVAILLGLGVLFFFSVAKGAYALAVGGMITAIGCTFVFIFIFAILMVFLSLLRQFFVRAAALEESGISSSFRRGWELFKGSWKSAALMWLVMLGIGIGYGIVGMILFLLLIPAYIIMFLPAILVAAIPAGIAFGITTIFAAGPLAWIVAAIVAIPFFFSVIFAPLTFVSGWYAIYSSSVWTLTYREIRTLEAVQPVEIPAPTA